MYFTIEQYQKAHGGEEACAREYLNSPKVCTFDSESGKCTVCKCGECIPEVAKRSYIPPSVSVLPISYPTSSSPPSAAAATTTTAARPSPSSALADATASYLTDNNDLKESQKELLSSIDEVVGIVRANDITQDIKIGDVIESGINALRRKIEANELCWACEQMIVQFCDAICVRNISVANGIYIDLSRMWWGILGADVFVAFHRIMKSCERAQRKQPVRMKLTPKMRDEHKSRFEAEQHRQLYGEARQNVIDSGWGDDISKYRD
jgi:hypothetical protein